MTKRRQCRCGANRRYARIADELPHGVGHLAPSDHTSEVPRSPAASKSAALCSA
jgi:hypothetical protein